MKVLLSIIIFISFILFIPIPLKLKISFSNNYLYIRFYKFTIFKKTFKVDKNSPLKKESNTVKKIKKETETFSINLYNKDKLKLLLLFKEKKFKPNLYIHGFFKYSLSDAAYTAIFLGVLNTYAPFLTWGLSIIFNIKKFKFPITPIFKDSFIVNTEINCIFTISIAKTMYIVIFLIINYIKIKGDELERENI